MREVKINTNGEITVGKELKKDNGQDLYLVCVERENIDALTRFMNEVDSIIGNMKTQYDIAEQYLKAYMDIFKSMHENKFDYINMNAFCDHSSFNPNYGFCPPNPTVNDLCYPKFPYGNLYNKPYGNQRMCNRYDYNTPENFGYNHGIKLASLKNNFEWDDAVRNIIFNLEDELMDAENKLQMVNLMHKKVDEILYNSKSADEFVQRIKERYPELIRESNANNEIDNDGNED